MSYSVDGTKITMTRGDTVRIQVAIDIDGEEYTPEVGDVVRFAAKKAWTDEEPCILITIPNDTLVLTIEPNDTKQLEFGAYNYDLQITFANGDVATFVTKAKLKIEEEAD